MKITEPGVYMAIGDHGSKFLVFIGGTAPFLKVNSIATVQGHCYSGGVNSDGFVSVNYGETVGLTIERKIC